jgi:hypothetical protein
MRITRLLQVAAFTGAIVLAGSALADIRTASQSTTPHLTTMRVETPFRAILAAGGVGTMVPISNFNQDPGGGGTEDCGPIDPDHPCYAGSKDDCVKAKSYSTCLSRCKCQYDKNKKKCDNKLACLQIAIAEKEACDGNCITDWN